jgi:hypothetical protein
MVLLYAAGILVVVSFIALFALRRRGNDRLHSVDGYRRTLTTLQDVRSRSLTGSGSVRILGSSSSVSDTERPARTLDPPSPAGTGRPPPDYKGIAVQPPARSARAGQRRRERAIAQMSRRPRRLGGPIAAAAVVIAAVTGLAIAGAHSRHPHPKTTTSTTKPGSHKPGTHPSSAGRHKGHTRPPPTTTTTFPTTFVASGSTSSTVTYSVPTLSYTLNLTTTTGASWIEVTNSAGTNVVAETLPAGQHTAVPLTGDARVILGAPGYIQVKVNSSAVVLPGGISELLFDTPAPPPTTTPTT